MQGNNDQDIAHLQGLWIITTTDERVTVKDMAITGASGTILMINSQDGSLYAEHLKLMEYKSTWARWIDTISGQSIYWLRPDGLDYESMDSISYMFNILLTRQTQTQDTCVRLEGQLHELRSELHTQVQRQVYASVPITTRADVPKNPIAETKENQNLSEIKYPDWKSESD